jgi:hypothetical protein
LAKVLLTIVFEIFIVSCNPQNGVIAILQNWWSILFCLLWIEQ